DVWAFQFWKEKTKGKYLWLRNNLSTLVSQMIDSIVFCLIAFLGVFPMSVWFEILITTYLFKLIVAIFDTPFIYLAKKMGASKKAPLL
ncbi:MAG TPA: queuosine precursor transporter, partial [Candidatus Izemoplasmatales bacterium]|nr:queuosine precursor transporter [Candidatus Izemoplasmatales bacterium]